MMKYVNTSIVFQEIPDEVTLAVNISNCPCRCPGCHSHFLWDDVGSPLTSDAVDGFMEAYGNDITCICFMGGDADPGHVAGLSSYIHRRYPGMKVGWYSGRIRVPAFVDKSVFDYVKVGPYIRHLGGLKERTTNQRMYKKGQDGEFADITSRFWR